MHFMSFVESKLEKYSKLENCSNAAKYVRKWTLNKHRYVIKVRVLYARQIKGFNSIPSENTN